MTKIGIQLKDENNNEVYPNPFPVGAIYMSLDSRNPSFIFGGTWERFSKGRVIVGVDESQNEFKTPGKTGGSKYMQKHYHRGISFGVTEPSEQDVMVSYVGGRSNRIALEWSRPGTVGNSTSNINTYSEGQGDSENLQPYIAVYIWHRVA